MDIWRKPPSDLSNVGVVYNLENEIVSLGDTVSTYCNRHGVGGFWVSSHLNSGKKVSFSFLGGGVLCELRSEFRKERVFFYLGGGGAVLCELTSEFRKEGVYHFRVGGGGVLCEFRSELSKES